MNKDTTASNKTTTAMTPIISSGTSVEREIDVESVWMGLEMAVSGIMNVWVELQFPAAA